MQSIPDEAIMSEKPDVIPGRGMTESANYWLKRNNVEHLIAGPVTKHLNETTQAIGKF